MQQKLEIWNLHSGLTCSLCSKQWCGSIEVCFGESYKKIESNYQAEIIYEKSRKVSLNIGWVCYKWITIEGEDYENYLL